MSENIKELLNEEIAAEIQAISSLNSGSEEKSKAIEDVVNVLNDYMTLYVNYNADDFEIKGCPSKEGIWWQMIQLLPSSYNQKRTVMLNYETLTGVYPMLKNHELDEWVEFRKWIEVLPYSEIIIGKAMGIKHDSIL